MKNFILLFIFINSINLFAQQVSPAKETVPSKTFEPTKEVAPSKEIIQNNETAPAKQTEPVVENKQVEKVENNSSPTKETNKTKIENDLSTGNYKLGLDGIFFPRYEFRDRASNGRDDAAGSTEESTGFGLSRTYLNLRGRSTDEKYEGYSFRLTSDIAPMGRLGDGCLNNTCSQSNPYTMYLKYAFISIPVLKRKDTFIRIGQQHDPTVNAQSRISLQEDAWAHRFVARTTWEEIGLSPSVDRGISIFHNSEYYAGHFLLGNGEGPFRNNGERLNSGFANPELAVSRLSAGVNDSHGLSVSSLVSFIPTGYNKKNILSVNFPFRFENVHGVNGNETQFLAADICGNQEALPPSAIVTSLNAPNTVCEYSQSGVSNFSFYKGTKRAKQDYSYGMETDYSLNLESIKFTLGVGTVYKVDRRGEALRLSRGLLYGENPNVSAANYTSYYQSESDRIGNANYILSHIKWKDYGAFFRHTLGTSGSVLGQVGTNSSKSWAEQVLEQDVKNNILGDFSYTDSNRLDLGRAMFKSTIVGATYQMTPDFLISFGVSESRATDSVGRRARENTLERVPVLPGSSATGKNASEQLESSQSFYSYTGNYNRLGYNLPGQFSTNEWLGKEMIDRQIFIRAQFIFGAVERMAERN
jgi:hypothetical protein